MMLAGSLLAAIADARAWRSRCGWAASPTLGANRAKARLAWLGLTGVPRSVRNIRGTVASVREQALEQSDCSDEHLPASSRTDRTVSLRGLLLPARCDRAGRPLVPALRSVLPRRRRTPDCTR